MSNPSLVPTDAEQLLSILKRSISEIDRFPDTTAVYFDPAPPSSPAPQHAPAQTQTPDDRLRAAELALEAATQALGSLPPFPATLRGRLGRILIRLVHRFLWWPLSAGRQVALELCQVVRTQREQQASFQQSIKAQMTELAAALHERDMQLHSLARTASLEPRPDRIPCEAPGGPTLDSRRAYLPLLLDAASGNEDAPWLDLPCGRGEWLNLLRQEHRQSYGVDANPEMVAACTSQGLHAIKADPLPYLAALPDSSVGVVTSLQAINAWPIGAVTTLVEQALRVLRPQGILILESSAPAISADLLHYIVESRGFERVQHLTSHPHYAIVGVRP